MTRAAAIHPFSALYFPLIVMREGGRKGVFSEGPRHAFRRGQTLTSHLPLTTPHPLPPPHPENDVYFPTELPPSSGPKRTSLCASVHRAPSTLDWKHAKGPVTVWALRGHMARGKPGGFFLRSPKRRHHMVTRGNVNTARITRYRSYEAVIGEREGGGCI